MSEPKRVKTAVDFRFVSLKDIDHWFMSVSFGIKRFVPSRAALKSPSTIDKIILKLSEVESVYGHIY